MVVELISVGTELLLGNIVNTNTQFLAEKCALLGLSMYHQSVVGDNEERLKDTIRTAIPVSYTHLDVYKRQDVEPVGGDIVEGAAGHAGLLLAGAALFDVSELLQLLLDLG